MTPTALSESVSSPPTAQKNCWLVVDFDGTCTEQETTSLLPKLAAKLSNSGALEERTALFKTFEDEYYRLYNAAKLRLCSETMSLEEALDSLDNVSSLVTEHVSASGVLKGLDVPPSTIAKLIEKDEQVRSHVKLRSGCLTVLARYVANDDWQLGILSINWSPSLIQATIVLPLSQQCVEREQSLLDDIFIWSNEVDSNGVVSLQVPGALAKRACIEKLKPNFVVYVGDSSTDLLALLEANVGILIGSSKSAVDTARWWGIQVLPLNQRGESADHDANVIWLAESWFEIDQALKDLSTQ